jgi:hypothetical protein
MIGSSRPVFVVRRRGDRQHPADRLDPRALSASVDASILSQDGASGNPRGGSADDAAILSHAERAPKRILRMKPRMVRLPGTPTSFVQYTCYLTKYPE